jgi:hypothetical protein
MRPLTIFLSRLIGLLFICISVAMRARRQAFVDIASGVVHDPPLLFILGLITLTVGLAIVLGHNNWSGGILPVVITLIGWITLIRGLFLLLAPRELVASLFEKMNFEKFFDVAFAITLFLGLYLTYMGFRPQRR